MSQLDKQLDKYAELAVKMGINIQVGQTLNISAPLAAVDLVRKIVAQAYEAGAKHVFVDWNDEQVNYLKYKLAPEEAFSEFPAWRARGLEELAEGGAAFLTIYAQNPDLLKDIDPKRVATAAKTQSTALSKYRGYLMSDINRWSLISVPTPEWAMKIFPDLDADAAIAQLWDVILEVTRVNNDDPVQTWKEHNARLDETVQYLNKKQYKQLVYEAEGTNLTVDLPENHVWAGGGAVCAKGLHFNPNMPTEEVFTMPHKNGVNGVVASTKPLNYGGNVIDNFTLTFKNGKVVEFTAEQGYEVLKHLLETDDGAGRLGEVALVPHQSPISESNLIFYNTLFDENASCHFALGKAYPTNIQNGTELTMEQLSEKGVNDSLIHVDFMMGSATMNIDGITADGNREPIFRNGNWAF